MYFGKNADCRRCGLHRYHDDDNGGNQYWFAMNAVGGTVSIEGPAWRRMPPCPPDPATATHRAHPNPHGCGGAISDIG